MNRKNLFAVAITLAPLPAISLPAAPSASPSVGFSAQTFTGLLGQIRASAFLSRKNGMADRFSRKKPGDKPEVSLKAMLFGETIYDNEGREYYAKYRRVVGEGHAKNGGGYGGVPYLVREVYDGNGKLVERREWRDD